MVHSAVPPYCNLLSRYCGVSHAGPPGDFQILRLDLSRYLPDSVPLLAVCCFNPSWQKVGELTCTVLLALLDAPATWQSFAFIGATKPVRLFNPADEVFSALTCVDVGDATSTLSSQSIHLHLAKRKVYVRLAKRVQQMHQLSGSILPSGGGGAARVPILGVSAFPAPADITVGLYRRPN